MRPTGEAAHFTRAFVVTCSRPKRAMLIILSYGRQLTPRALASVWPLLLSPWANMESRRCTESFVCLAQGKSSLASGIGARCAERRGISARPW